MNQYEIAVLFDPGLEVDLSKSTAKLEKIVTDNKGKIVKSDNWGKRKLAYQIDKHEYALYVFYTVELPAQSVAKVDTTLNITDEVIRHLITRPDLKAIAKAEAQKAEKAKKNLAGGSEQDDSGEER
ncbi:30S ribosomal protein S6 [Candidatus Parcubacteria bacterium]|nr:30S ribosomal protein S6 [Candidatus Parcubacteria bacterium]